MSEPNATTLSRRLQQLGGTATHSADDAAEQIQRLGLAHCVYGRALINGKPKTVLMGEAYALVYPATNNRAARSSKKAKGER